MIRSLSNFKSIGQSLLLQIRCAATQVNPKQENFSFDFENALPYEKVPGPSKLKIIINSLPGGKYYKKTRREISTLSQEEYGDLVKIPSMFGRPEYIFSYDPKNSEIIYRTEGIWPKRMYLESLNHYRTKINPDPFKTGSLITANGDAWGKFRSVVNPIMMNPKNVKNYTPQIDKTSSELVQRIRNIRDKTTLETPGNFLEDLNRWSLESVCIIGFDTKLNLIHNYENNEDARSLIEAVNTIFASDLDLGVMANFFKYYETKEFKKLMSSYDVLTKISQKYIEMAIKKIEANINEEKDEKSKSMLEKLLKANKDIAVVMALDILFGGVDTASSAISGCLLNLSKNPEKQNEMRKEVCKVLPKPDSEVTVEALNELSYVRAVIKESMRLNPVLDEVARATGQEIVLNGYKIPQGIDVLMMSYSFYKSEKNFKNADQFLPERWLRKTDENSDCPITGSKASNPFTFLPFGFGKRMCIGKRFVDMELEIALAKIIRNFKVEFNYDDRNFFAQGIINKPAMPLKFKFSDV